ncbi:Glycosyl transferase family 2 [Collimonas sp. OK607]|uniref:glycosyltransferase family 2 protein n=1 Tax=Collimonas sp. OK607 TaxID=1798194 RepID=UPI0008DF68BF|nr:glycosyltransferase family A protein [Collimonas sp. OK607]SFA69828.1 Glycosyl transferase family 2 [Collimonas sp. OK607]
MKFSLILATVGRSDEVSRLLASLDAQDYRNFELIVVDQNKDDRLVAMLTSYREKFAIQHVRSAAHGVSRARNVGLGLADGDVISFPDDDCWYPAGLLQKVATELNRHPELDGLTGRFTDGDGRTEGRWLESSALLNRYNVWRGAIEFSIFLRRRVVDAVGNFNELLGVGAGTVWGAAEGTDYLLRSLQHGFKLKFLVDLTLHHPVKTIDFDDGACNRQKKYETGIGHVMRINDYPLWYFPATCLRTCAGILLAMAKGDFPKARFKYVSVLARMHGWRG